ncbi:19840_t:CDS:2 [Cetraspora pellucida]|uniref:19840_t:CDS:1 n=1 Tax=Cetraspora pellucida TaxID=1433469 RepID=A0A9N9CZ72_9GLOM|nr:19840_t:CDS:2 [Cetraspora pellucida]
MQIENPDELLDAKPNECDECFNIMDQLQGLQQNTLEQLVKNAKTKIWTTSSPSGSKKITNMFSLKNIEVFELYIENYNFTFDDIYNSSDNNNSKFTLESLDLLLKNKSDDLQLRMTLLLHEDFKLRVTEYLHTYKFTLRIAEFVKFIEDEIIPPLLLSEIVLITQNESLFYAKDGAVKA